MKRDLFRRDEMKFMNAFMKYMAGMSLKTICSELVIDEDKLKAYSAKNEWDEKREEYKSIAEGDITLAYKTVCKDLTFRLNSRNKERMFMGMDRLKIIGRALADAGFIDEDKLTACSDKNEWDAKREVYKSIAEGGITLAYKTVCKDLTFRLNSRNKERLFMGMDRLKIIGRALACAGFIDEDDIFDI